MAGRRRDLFLVLPELTRPGLIFPFWDESERSSDAALKSGISFWLILHPLLFSICIYVAYRLI